VSPRRSTIEDRHLGKPLLAEPGLTSDHRFLAPFAMRKLLSLFPDLRASRSQSGCEPRPAQVCEGSFGLRYFGGTDPIGWRPRTFPVFLWVHDASGPRPHFEFSPARHDLFRNCIINLSPHIPEPCNQH
jgi:hypothetical protein